MKLITADAIQQIYEPLFAIGALGTGLEDGYLRASWSGEESAAFAYIGTIAEGIGLQVRFDDVGNMIVEQRGFLEYVETGSHLDTVIRGGNFDGAAGIVAGISAMNHVLDSKETLRCGLRMRIWRGEESATYAIACKGSRAAVGKLPAAALQYAYRGQTLEQAIVSQGYTAAPIEQGRPTLSAAELDSIRAHIELHIEQANSLEQQAKDIGVVTSIRGPIRWHVFLEGRFDHSGGTPMGTRYRKDVNLALAYTLVALDKLASEQKNDLVQTVGEINSHPQLHAQYPQITENGVTKVSGFGYFSLDIRSAEKSFRESYAERALLCIQETCAHFGVTSRAVLISSTDPVEKLDQEIQAAQLAAAESLGYAAISLPSGAVHDCAYLGQQTRSDGSLVPIGMVFIPCRDGLSHSPHEFATFEQVAKGANVLAQTFLTLAK